MSQNHSDCGRSEWGMYFYVPEKKRGLCLSHSRLLDFPYKGISGCSRTNFFRFGVLCFLSRLSPFLCSHKFLCSHNWEQLLHNHKKKKEEGVLSFFRVGRTTATADKTQNARVAKLSSAPFSSSDRLSTSWGTTSLSEKSPSASLVIKVCSFLLSRKGIICCFLNHLFFFFFSLSPHVSLNTT